MPGRLAELGRHRAERLDLPGPPTVQIPPVCAVRDEVQHAVGRPLGLADRFGRSAGDLDRLVQRPGLIDVGDPQLAAVPGQVRVIPGEPGQVFAVGRQARRRVEIVARHQERPAVQVAAGADRDEGVDRFAGAGVILAHGDQMIPCRIEDGIRKAVGRRGGDGDRGGVAGLAIQPLVVEVAEPEHAVGDHIGPAAVFVNAGPGVESLWRAIERCAIRLALDDDLPSALGRPQFDPIHIRPIRGHLGQLDGLCRDAVGGDGRFPRTVRGDRAVAHAAHSRCAASTNSASRRDASR